MHKCAKIFNSFFQSVVEKVVYRCSDTEPDKTIAIRSAWIDSQMFGFSRAIRTFGCERFKKNCIKMVNRLLFLTENVKLYETEFVEILF